MTAVDSKEAEDQQLSVTDYLKFANNCFVTNLEIDRSTAKSLSLKLRDFIKDEEYDMETVVDDFVNGCNDSEMVNLVSEELNKKTEEDLKNIELALKRLFKLEPNKIRILNELEWTVTSKELSAARQYIQEQCPKMIKDGENESIITIVAVGKKNQMKNLLCLIYDAFTKYRMKHKLMNPQLKLKSSNDYSSSDEPLLKDLSVPNRNHVRYAIESYESRFVPGYKFDRALLYEDSCSDFIRYTILVAKALNSFVKQANVTVAPLQVDLLIIPKKFIKSKFQGMDTFSDDDSSDDDDDDEEEESKVECKVPTADDLSSAFEKVMDGKYNKKYSKEETDVGDKVRKLVTHFNEYVRNNHQRISIVIDRRTKPMDTIYVYTLPAEDGSKNGMIPKDYCTTTLVFMSSKFVVPVWDERMNKAGAYPFVGGKYAAGNYFLVSYQMMEDSNTRLQWNFGGNGMRLTPEVMIKIWPTVFVSDKLDEEFNETYIRNEMNLSDPLFDEWVQP